MMLSWLVRFWWTDFNKFISHWTPSEDSRPGQAMFWSGSLEYSHNASQDPSSSSLVKLCSVEKYFWSISILLRRLVTSHEKREEASFKQSLFFLERGEKKEEWLINLSVGDFNSLSFTTVDVSSPLRRWINIWDELGIIGLDWKHTFFEDYGWLARLELERALVPSSPARWTMRNCKVIKIISNLRSNGKWCSTKRSTAPPYH